MKNNLISILLIIFICFTFAGVKRNYICIDKETPDWTGTTQGNEHKDSVENNHLHKCIRISERAQREMDSVDNYMRHWYEVLDTNSNGQIDDTE